MPVDGFAIVVCALQTFAHCGEVSGGFMASKRSADGLYISQARELEEEPYSSDDEDDEEDEDLFDADELGLDPEMDDDYYAAAKFFQSHDRQPARAEPAGRLAV